MLHENIKQLRLKKGITQSQLADRLHVVRQTVSKWEKGSSVPDALMLQKIAEALDTDINTLLDCPAEAAKRKQQTNFSKFWLLFTLFWALFLCLAPVDADWRYLSPSDTPHFNLTYTVLQILSQMRHYLASPLLAAGIIFILRSAIQIPFTLPAPIRKTLHIAGSILAALGLINGIRFTFAVFFGIDALPFYTWLNFHTWVFTLWMITAAILLSLSAKETTP